MRYAVATGVLRANEFELQISLKWNVQTVRTNKQHACGTVQIVFLYSFQSPPVWSGFPGEQIVRAVMPSVIKQLNVKADWQVTGGIFVLTSFLCLHLQQKKKGGSDNEENNNIYLLIRSLYISWYNSDILLLAKIL